MDDVNKYRSLFFEESDEYLQNLNDCLLQLEKDPDNKSIIDEIFRAAHTLKGMAATMGYQQMAELTHRMENVLELFRNGTLSITSEVVSLIFSCLDSLSNIVEDLRKDKYLEYDLESLFKNLDNINNKIDENSEMKNEELNVNEHFNKEINSTDKMIIKAAYEKKYISYKIMIRLSKDCMLKGARAYLIISKLEQQGDIIQTDPCVEVLEEGTFGDVFSLIYLTKISLNELNDLIENVPEIDDIQIKKIVIEDEAEKEIAVTAAEQITDLTSYTDKLDTKKDIKKDDNKEKNNVQKIGQSIRVDLNRLDSIMNLVSELVIYRTRLEELSTKYRTTEINEPLEHVARITSDLQDLVLRIRMQPVNVVFNRFPRMIRDLSKELEKEINLIIEGEETELDRTVVSEIGEPLVHLIRNAADHGIEKVEERLKSGKDKVGTINLSAYQEGNKVVIKISDDGKGIDPHIIKQSAISKGINVDGMDDKDIVQLIFNQGFSTTKKITNISGRGVGMDVVKQKITSLGGSVEVQSEVNKGTTFTVKLPLTLSIIQALLVYVGKETFAIPLGIIEKVVSVTQNEIVKSHNEEVYIYRNKAVPVIRVNEKLGIQSEEEMKHIILVMLGENYYGLLVDDLIGQQEIVIKKLGNTFRKMKEYIGATILGNGDITLILDVGNLCNKGEGDIIE